MRRLRPVRVLVLPRAEQPPGRRTQRNYPGLYAYVQKLEQLSGTILDWNNTPPRSIAQKAESGERRIARRDA